eukprot:5034079-Pyramimonas_sp.AAC.1
MADPNAPPRLQHVSAPQPVNIAFTSRVLSASLPLLAQEDPHARIAMCSGPEAIPELDDHALRHSAAKPSGATP